MIIKHKNICAGIDWKDVGVLGLKLSRWLKSVVCMVEEGKKNWRRKRWSSIAWTSAAFPYTCPCRVPWELPTCASLSSTSAWSGLPDQPSHLAVTWVLHIFWLNERCQLFKIPSINSAARELRTSWISTSAKFWNSPPVTSRVSMRLLHISSCWLENAQKSLTAFGQRFFQQPSRAVGFGATTESFIFTV